MPERIKPSVMLVRLDAEVTSAKNAVEADCKRLERAAYRSRLGHFDQSRSELESMRQKYRDNPSVIISSWLNLVDGITGHMKNMDSSAREKILRAYALSSAANLPYIRPLSAAWLAQMDYLQVDTASMAKHAAEALQFSSETEHSVRSRANLVVAQAYHFAGRLDLALPWYGRARSHAVEEADDATLSALMHNMAWLRGQRLRASDCGLAADLTAVEEHALVGANSTANYDLMIGSTSLQALLPILRAQILTVRAQYFAALEIFEAELASALREGLGRLQADLLADQAWCRFQCGQLDAAAEDASLAEASIDVNGHFDDRALAYGRLAQIYNAIGKPEIAHVNRELAAAAWLRHTSLQSKIIAALANF